MAGPVIKLQTWVLKYQMPNLLRKFLASPTGPFTIFFWCSSCKWFISFINIGDLKLPVECISTYQQMVLMATGITWARYCTVITPINLNLMSANLFMFSVASYQLYRKYSVSGKLFD